MEPCSSLNRRLINESDLKDWEKIDSGGFGNVYKVRHHQWGSHVAIKMLRIENHKSLLREINMMLQGSSQYVIQVLGVFSGRPPFGQTLQHGVVMELMERGSLASLQKSLQGTPPWPLVVRLAHQVALGTNFLHNLSPPVLHLDLKPSNVLLDPSLNAKLTDFGLSRFYHSNSLLSRADNIEEGGTIPYMPPEAFNLSYKPTKASDIYSYGILLWSIITGKQPYPNPISSLVRLQIPNGQRPSLDKNNSPVLGYAESAVMIDLMQKCWVGTPEQRPLALTCVTVTEELYKVQKPSITDAVHEVLKKLDQEEKELIEQVQKVYITGASAAGASTGEMNVYNSVPTGNPPVQEMANGGAVDQRDSIGFKDSPSHPPWSKSEVDLSSLSKNSKAKKSSVHPIKTPTSSSSTGQSPLRRMRQCLIPSLFACFPVQSEPVQLIKINHVTGLQHGNNNTMNIDATEHDSRRRHPSAPSSVNLPPTRSGSRRDKTES